MDKKIQTLCRLPKGAMPTEVVEICAFIDQAGTNRWVYRLMGDSPLSTTLGLIEMAKYHITGNSVPLGSEEDMDDS